MAEPGGKNRLEAAGALQSNVQTTAEVIFVVGEAPVSLDSVTIFRAPNKGEGSRPWVKQLVHGNLTAGIMLLIP